MQFWAQVDHRGEISIRLKGQHSNRCTLIWQGHHGILPSGTLNEAVPTSDKFINPIIKIIIMIVTLT